MSLTEISDFPKFSCRLWRCFTMDRSSFPQRQVVFRIKTTIVLTSACSLVCLLDKSPIAPNIRMGFIVFKGLYIGHTTSFSELNTKVKPIKQATFEDTNREPLHNNSLGRQLSGIPIFGKVPTRRHCFPALPNGILWHPFA